MGISFLKGKSGIDTSDATATSNDIISPATAYVNGEKITGKLMATYKDVETKFSMNKLNEGVTETTAITIDKSNVYLISLKNSQISIINQDTNTKTLIDWIEVSSTVSACSMSEIFKVGQDKRFYLFAYTTGKCYRGLISIKNEQVLETIEVSFDDPCNTGFVIKNFNKTNDYAVIAGVYDPFNTDYIYIGICNFKNNTVNFLEKMVFKNWSITRNYIIKISPDDLWVHCSGHIENAPLNILKINSDYTLKLIYNNYIGSNKFGGGIGTAISDDFKYLIISFYNNKYIFKKYKLNLDYASETVSATEYSEFDNIENTSIMNSLIYYLNDKVIVFIVGYYNGTKIIVTDSTGKQLGTINTTSQFDFKQTIGGTLENDIFLYIKEKVDNINKLCIKLAKDLKTIEYDGIRIV